MKLHFEHKQKAARVTDWLMVPIYLAAAAWFAYAIYDGLDEPSALEIVQDQLENLQESQVMQMPLTVKPDPKKDE